MKRKWNLVWKPDQKGRKAMLNFPRFWVFPLEKKKFGQKLKDREYCKSKCKSISCFNNIKCIISNLSLETLSVLIFMEFDRTIIVGYKCIKEKQIQIRGEQEVTFQEIGIEQYVQKEELGKVTGWQKNLLLVNGELFLNSGFFWRGCC